jgi:hypothetical protein
MYGLVNKAIEDLVVSTAGEDVWVQIKSEAGLPELEICNATNYDDKVSLDIIEAASRVLNIPVETLLFEFGRHWVSYTNREGWSHYFRMEGHGLIDCLKGLDEMHQRVKDAMPDGRMPFFKIAEAGDDFYLDYCSTRAGFVPMVKGIVQGLGERFGETWKVVHLSSHQQRYGCERFLLQQIAEGTSDEQQRAA